MQSHCFFSMLLPDTLGGLVAADEPGVWPKFIIIYIYIYIYIYKKATRLSLLHNN